MNKKELKLNEFCKQGNLENYGRISLCLFLFISFRKNCEAQSQIIVNSGISYSVNKNIRQVYAGGALYDYSYERYKYPSLLINSDLGVPLNHRLLFDIKSGFNFHFREQYFSSERRSIIVNSTIQGGLNYNLWQTKRIVSGIGLLSGINIIFLSGDYTTINPGAIHTINLYLIKNKHVYKIGVEKEIQNIAVFDPLINKTIEHNLSRILIFFTYGLTIK